MSRQSWRVKKILFMAILFVLVIYGQMGGIGLESLQDVEPTMSQAVHEVWSMIALVGLMIISLMPLPSEGVG